MDFKDIWNKLFSRKEKFPPAQADGNRFLPFLQFKMQI